MACLHRHLANGEWFANGFSCFHLKSGTSRKIRCTKFISNWMLFCARKLRAGTNYQVTTTENGTFCGCLASNPPPPILTEIRQKMAQLKRFACTRHAFSMLSSRIEEDEQRYSSQLQFSQISISNIVSELSDDKSLTHFLRSLLSIKIQHPDNSKKQKNFWEIERSSSRSGQPYRTTFTPLPTCQISFSF